MHFVLKSSCLIVTLTLTELHLCFPDFFMKNFVKANCVVFVVKNQTSKSTLRQVRFTKKNSAVLSKSVIIGFVGHSHAHLVCRRRNLTKLHWNAIFFRKLQMQNCNLNVSFSFAQKWKYWEHLLFCLKSSFFTLNQ